MAEKSFLQAVAKGKADMDISRLVETHPELDGALPANVRRALDA